jgi:hypothetical protein
MCHKGDWNCPREFGCLREKYKEVDLFDFHFVSIDFVVFIRILCRLIKPNLGIIMKNSTYVYKTIMLL